MLNQSANNRSLSLGMKDNRFGKAFDGDKGYDPAARQLGAIDRTGARKI
jgi:hypothetical protein